MDSDESQDASSGNESDVASRHSSHSGAASHKSSRSDLRSRSRSKSRSHSRSRSRSSSRSRSRSSEPPPRIRSPDDHDDDDDSNPAPPAPSESGPKSPRSPASPKSRDTSPPRESAASGTIRSPSPPNNPSPPRSPNSSRSNSPANVAITQNNHESSLNHRRNSFNEDSLSDKSSSSSNSHKSERSTRSRTSRSSRDGRQAANLDDGTTDSSSSSDDDDTSADKKDKKLDTQAEEISDGDMESDHEKPAKNDDDNEQASKSKELSGSLAHEDLSDVSDLEDSIDDISKPSSEMGDNDDLQDELESKTKKAIERSSRNEDVEEQLDFEAEDGECGEPDEKPKDKDDKEKASEQEAGELDDDPKKPDKEPEELEEGELTDEDDARPEETEPRPVCRFFSRGQCTWGASCRFLHPGVTDKGNYTMFDLVRPVVPGDYGNERMMYGGRMEPPPMESAWERGLRTAKEMMRKSIKRKEQDIDFEEKKMNLSLAQEEFDKENGYYAKAPSPPEPRYVTVRHSTPVDYPPARAPQEEYYGRRQVVYESEYTPAAPPPRERYRPYREAPPHRQPDYYNSGKHEDDANKAKRPKREVIVQRVEERSGRGDEWSDPWMRLKSPAGRKGARKRSYSSGSSYSSSSSSRSSSASSGKSSYRSRSRSSHKKRSPRSSHRRQVSPSVIVSERKAANERAALMNPPAPRKKPPSPSMMRLGAQNPPAPSKVDQFGRTRSKLAVAAALARVKGRTRSSRSSSGSSSGSSSSDSESSGSSSSSSRNGSPSPRRPSGMDLAMALKAQAIDALKSGSEKKQIKLNLKNAVGPKKPDFNEITRKAEVSQSRKRLANSPPAGDPKSIANKKASSRREELLKQLKAVEDAIAKKRSKV